MKWSLVFVGLLYLGDVDLLPVLERKCLKPGFHKDLQTTIRIPETNLEVVEHVECFILFTEIIPSGAYVDPFQIISLKPHGGPDAIVLDEVDTEKPEFESKEHSVNIFSNMTLQDNTWTADYNLPVHVRYHSVSDKLFDTVTFTNPEISIRCFNNQLGTVHYGYKGETVKMKNDLCYSNKKLICDWTVIQYQSETDSVSVVVPVGQSEHFMIVTVVTIITTMLGCIILTLKTLYKDIKIKES
ncbi:hypothetical protein ACF0H5_000928 [Mactra antiquata]